MQPSQEQISFRLPSFPVAFVATYRNDERVIRMKRDFAILAESPN